MKIILFLFFLLISVVNSKSQDFTIHEFPDSWVLEYKTDTFSILQNQNMLLQDSIIKLQSNQTTDSTIFQRLDSLQLEIIGKDEIITTLNQMMENQTQLSLQKIQDISHSLLLLINSMDSLKVEVDSLKIPIYNVVFPDSSFYQYHND